MEHILSMIGLAKKAGRVEIGEEPVGAAARAKHARVILVAEDAGASSVRRAYSFAQSGACLCLTVGVGKDELGSALGRTSVAMAAITDIGLAESIVKKLAALDSERYGAAAEQLSVKAKRAAERKREQLQHEKNVQQGKKKAKPVPKAAAETKPEQPAAPKKTTPRKAAARKPVSPAPTERFANSRPVKKGKGSVKKK